MSVPKTTRPWRKAALAGVTFAVALEAVLQLGALFAALTTPSRATAAAAEVVCVGDSFTFGTGASSPAASYPLQLQARLREAGHDVAVRNGGYPSKDSAYVLRQLPSLLGDGARVLCVMVGNNDGWSRPEPVPDAEVGADDGTQRGGRFVLRWRTGRLLALLGRGRAPVANAPAATPDTPADGGIADAAAGFTMLEAAGVIPREPLPVVLPPPCPEAQRPGVDEVARLVQARDGPRARDLARELVSRWPDSPDALRALALAASQCGDQQEVDGALARLERLANDGDPAAVESCMLAAYHTGRPDRARAVARARVAREPAALLAWHVLQHTAFVRGDREEFERAAATGLRLAGRASPRDSAWVVRNYARVIAAKDPARAAVLVAAGTLLDGDTALTRGTLQQAGVALPWRDAEAALAAAPARPDAVAVLRSLFAPPSPDDGARWPRVLREHLAKIGRFAQQRGVRVVIASYPFPYPELEHALRAVAADLGVPFVGVREHFDVLLQQRARDELFVRDGHCNDAGYAVVAELLAPVVAAELSR